MEIAAWYVGIASYVGAAFRRLRGVASALWLRAKAVGILTAALLLAADTLAQQPFGPRSWFRGIRTATADSFDGAFNFCRVMFRANPYGDGGGWSVDYPMADINFSIRLSELTKTVISRNAAGDPNHFVLRLTDAELFQCPFIMMTEVGRAYFDGEEAARLRDYLLKGGFLWADDFWGSYAWDVWAREIGKVLPAGEYPIVDLPAEHPMFRTMFVLDGVPQIPSINFWWGSGGRTSERGADSSRPHARAILDRHGRIMVLMTHNTDIGDSWEREGEHPDYFRRFSLDGYAFGINALLYAMTH